MTTGHRLVIFYSSVLCKTRGEGARFVSPKIVSWAIMGANSLYDRGASSKLVDLPPLTLWLWCVGICDDCFEIVQKLREINDSSLITHDASSLNEATGKPHPVNYSGDTTRHGTTALSDIDSNDKFHHRKDDNNIDEIHDRLTEHEMR